MRYLLVTLIGILFSFGYGFGQEQSTDIVLGLNCAYTPIPGFYATFHTVKIQPDGKVLAVGAMYGPEECLLVARYNRNGILDETFGENGISIIDLGTGEGSNCREFLLLDDGKMIICVMTEWQMCINLVKLNPDGSLDDSFGSEGVMQICYTDVLVQDMLEQNDGKILVCGYTETAPEKFSLIRCNADGSLDSAFGENGISKYDWIGAENPNYRSTVSSAYLSEDGRIFLGGTSKDDLGNPEIDSLSRCMTIVCVDNNGSLSDSFGNNGVLSFCLWPAEWWQLDDFVVLEDSSIIYAGHTGFTPNIDIVGKLNSSGIIDSSFNNIGYVEYNDGINNLGGRYTTINVLENNDIIIMSEIYSNEFMLRKYHNNGDIDNSFGSSGVLSFGDGTYDTRYYDFEVHSNGKIVVAGHVYDSVPALCQFVPRNNVSGTVFIDDNFNQNYDEDEQGVGQHIIKIEPGPFYTNSDVNGSYYFSGDPGTYTITCLPKQYWYLTNYGFDYTAIIENEESIISDLDFGVAPRTSITDVSISAIGTATRPLFDVFYWLNFSSLGTNTQSGVIKMEYDPMLMFLETSVNPISHIDNEIVWEYDTLTSMEGRNILLRFQVPGTEYLGDTLVSYCSISPFVGDTCLSNNYDTIRQEITGSYDPNDKLVYPPGISTNCYVLHDSELNYTIRFQNTGTDTAFNIIVNDTLDSNLDIETFKLIGSSHPCSYRIISCSVDSVLIRYSFDNILLPPKITNEPGSNGFIKFLIYPKNELPDYTQVTNQANIYFDYNPPISTNQTLTTLVSSLGEMKTSNIQYIVYPNPTRGKIIVKIDRLKSLSVYSADGKHLKSLVNTNQIDLDYYPDGLYYIKIETEEGSFTEKVIKESK